MNIFSIVIQGKICRENLYEHGLQTAICQRFFGIVLKGTVKTLNKEFIA